MRHRLLILITGLLIFLMVGFTQNHKEKIVLRSTQQSMLFSIESMNNVSTYEETTNTVLPKKGEFSHTCHYNYDDIESNDIVDILLFGSNMTNFTSTDNAKYCRSNG
jgi:hypothetical protein